ncbi:MAG: pyridoxal-phosphate dependent enzyme [Chitinophagaceae bacterium]|jgi:1-aminocyclopropane-1-carboxylate deaminase
MAITNVVDEGKIFIQSLDGFVPDGVRAKVSMLRLDTMHPLISGNKWYKLKYNIVIAKSKKAPSIVTFGGAYSNHLIATAAAAMNAGIPSVGIVRGLQDEENLNSVLLKCKEMGMELQFVSREAYSLRDQDIFLDDVDYRYPNSYVIPEGGANIAGQIGAGEIATLIPEEYTHILLSVGSGTTFIGLRNTLPAFQHLFGFVPMKNGTYLNNEISTSLFPLQNKKWELTDRFHFGGFGKITSEIQEFMPQFEARYGFPLDRVYTAKMMLGLQEMLAERAFSENAEILCIHSGGLTGN